MRGHVVNIEAHLSHAVFESSRQPLATPKVISERLGHATAAFTFQTYTHVIPGMDESVAATVAALILSKGPTADAEGRTSGRMEDEDAQKEQLAWAKAQASDGSGGRI